MYYLYIYFTYKIKFFTGAIGIFCAYSVNSANIFVGVLDLTCLWIFSAALVADDPVSNFEADHSQHEQSWEESVEEDKVQRIT